MRRRRRLACRGALTAACALGLAAPAAASTVSLDDITAPDGSITGRFAFTAAGGEVNRVTMTFAPGNDLLVADSAGIAANGRCGYPNPLDHTVVSCDGQPGRNYGAAVVTLDDRDDSLLVRAAPGVTPTMSISAGAGNDVVIAGPGPDLVYGDGGVDVVHGGAGPDVLFGESGNDRLYGDAGDDRLEGGLGNDRLFGGLGDDYLLGASGNDILLTGPGRDRAVPGEGRNLVDGRPAN